MLNSQGLRVSVAGAVIFFASLLSLLVLPAGPAIAGVAIGGCTVFGGFVWTLLSYYGPSHDI